MLLSSSKIFIGFSDFSSKSMALLKISSPSLDLRKSEKRRGRLGAPGAEKSFSENKNLFVFPAFTVGKSPPYFPPLFL
jgi:hypothetical protein